MANLREEIEKRRTFAIISHPDAGKTTLTEKFLLYGGAINLAGTVKGRKSAKHAVSDWMEIEKERGISVTSSVLQFNYDGRCINILDTPGHQDFSEDTYRTLMAADSAVMVIDGAKGVEPQTIKLFKVCVMRHIPIFTFINKFDREARDPYELLDEIEEVLGIRTCPINWPIGCGHNFKGVFDREKEEVDLFHAAGGGKKEVEKEVYSKDDPKLEGVIGKEYFDKLQDDLELLEGAAEVFDEEKVDAGLLTPVFFGSALNNFGVRELLDCFVEIAPSPLPKASDVRIVQPNEKGFTGFVFKIHANMDPNHRDRLAFVKIVSGTFERNKPYLHTRLGKKLKFSSPNAFFAEKKEVVDISYAGDIVGLHDTGNFKIGDTFTEGEVLHFKGIPSFSPEHFRYINNADPLKSKQLEKGIDQLMDEGVAQLFTLDFNGRKVIGTVGALQYEVIQYRLEHEYGAKCSYENFPIFKACWVEEPENPKDPDYLDFLRVKQKYLARDKQGQLVFLADSAFSIEMVKQKYPQLKLHFTSEFDK